MVAGSRNALIEKILGLRWLDLNQRLSGREPKVGFYQEVGTDRSTLAVVSLGGFGGLNACGATCVYIMPLPNIFLTRLFSKTRLKRKDFQDIAGWLGRRGAPTVPASFLLACLRYQASARGCASNAAFAVMGHAYCGRTPLRRRGIGRYSTVGWCRTGCG